MRDQGSLKSEVAKHFHDTLKKKNNQVTVNLIVWIDDKRSVMFRRKDAFSTNDMRRVETGGTAFRCPVNRWRSASCVSRCMTSTDTRNTRWLVTLCTHSKHMRTTTTRESSSGGILNERSQRWDLWAEKKLHVQILNVLCCSRPHETQRIGSGPFFAFTLKQTLTLTFLYL